MKNILNALSIAGLVFGAVFNSQAQPANDNFANSWLIQGVTVTTNGNNNGATTENGEPNIVGTQIRNSVWFHWVAPATGTARIDTFGSSWDTYLAVYTGTSVSALTVIAGNNNAFDGTTASQVSFTATSGTTYKITVARNRFVFGTGPYNLHLEMPPSVSITSPANNSVVGAGSQLTLTASASSPAGTVTKVDFYRAGILIGSDAVAPYSITASNSPLGTNSFFAVVTDSTSQVATSAVVNVAFLNTGVTVTSPADGVVFLNTNPITVSVVAVVPSGSVTNVEFLVNGQKFGAATTSPYSAAWNGVVPGSHQLTAIGRVDNGSSYTSAPVAISVARILVASNSVWKYLDDGSDQGTSWIAPNFNDSSWLSGPGELGYGDTNDVPPRPEATMLSYGPDPNNKYITTYFRHAFVVTNAASYSNFVLRVLRDDGAVVYLKGIEAARYNMGTAGPITFTTLAANAADDGTVFYPTNVAASFIVEGTNVLAVEIHQNTVTSSDISFDLELLGVPGILRNQPPSVALMEPTNNSYFFIPTNITLTASASDPDGSVAKVEFYVDGAKLGESATGPYTFVWTNAPIGAHLLKAVVTDDQGASATSAQMAVTIYNEAGSPLVQITNPASGAIFDGPTNVTIAASADSAFGVTNMLFLANGSVIGNDASSPYSLVWSNATFGTNALTAIASDARGVSGTSAVVSITVNSPPINTNPPTIYSVNPAPGANITNLTSIQVIFSERVLGVNASDLLINDSPATGVSGSGSNYTFTVTKPGLGTVYISWASGHGITDIGYPANLPFDENAPSANWTYNLLDLTPPTVLAKIPAAGASLTNLTQINITFSEPVTGVGASDMLINGNPAIGLSGSGSNYTFSFSQPPPGAVNISWIAGHGITDLGAPPNAFNAAGAGATWSYTLDTRTIFIQTNAPWLFVKGMAEASSPIDAWRGIGFNDASWSNAFAPFYYGDPYNTPGNPGTLLSDMQGGYTSIFLRKNFTVANVAAVTNLILSAQIDDGFIVWINGVEVSRYNMPGGDVPYNGVALASLTELPAGGFPYTNFALPNPSTYLVNGVNVIAVQAFNVSLSGSSDFGFNAQLYTYLADASLVAPRIASVNPPAGNVSYLTNISITFTEPVEGVDSVDLLVNGVPANGLIGTWSNSTYTFLFPQPAYGNISITWDVNHEINDFDAPPKVFNATAPGSTFQYTLLNPNAPNVVSQSPVGGSTLGTFTQATVTFSKPVTGVNAGDFLVNGAAAGGVSGGPSTYTFTFPQPAFGAVSIGWAANHGIQDLDIPANNFDPSRTGNTWTYTLTDQTPPTIASRVPTAGSQVTNLTQTTVTFSEPVSGVNASDLLINGVPATGVSGGPSTYTFTFAQANSVIINLTWAQTHGIQDLAAAPNSFNATGSGATWTYTTPDTLPPAMLSIEPPPNISVRSLTQIRVTFTEPVSGVDTNDLIVNGHKAIQLAGSGAGPYTFTFSALPNGPVEVRWAVNHGIVDLATPPNPFAGGEWNYILDPNASFADKIVINEIMFDALSGRPADEWIELHNVTTDIINLAGWRFKKGVDFTFPNISIPGGGFLVVAANLAAFQAKYPTVTNVIGDWVGQLPNNGKTIELVSALDETVNSVHYATEGDWARRERGSGASLVSGITRSGSTATVSLFAHGFTANDQVIISGADQPEYNGRFVVGGVTPSTFTITVTGTPATPATGNILCRLALDDGFSGWSWFSAASGFGNSLELLNPKLPNSSGQNWLASAGVGGTPGRVNSMATNNIAPFIQDVTHAPAVPRSTDPVAITARVSDELSNGVQSVTLFYRNHTAGGPPGFSSLAMFDDGAHSDGVSKDGLYGAVVPPAANGAVIEFYVQATDTTGHARTWPAPSWETNNTFGQFANALYQVDNETVTNAMPVIRLVLSGTEKAIFPPSTRSSDAAMNATLVSTDGEGMKVRYLCDVRVRGAGTRTRTPPGNRLNIPNDNPWNGRNAVNLNSQFVHAQLLGNAAAAKAGLPAENPYVVQYRVNGVNPAPITAPVNNSGNGAGWGVFLLLKPVDGDLAADQYPNDSNGNVYRASTTSHNADLSYQGTDPNSYLNRGVYKTSNKTTNDWTDLFNLTFAFSMTGANADYVQAISTNVNVLLWMRYFAVSSLMSDGETKLGNGIGDDYAMYRGEVDKRFVIFAHDFDTVFGQGDSTTIYPTLVNSSIFIMLNPPNSSANVPLLRRFMTNAAFAPLFYSELKRLADTVFSPPQFNPLVDQLLTGWGGVSPDVTTIANIKAFNASRRAVVLSQIPLTLTVSNSLTSSNGLLRTTTPAVTLYGTANAIDTRSVLVNGNPAAWSAFDVRWTNTLTLSPGINRVLVQSLDSNNVEFARATQDIWYDTGTNNLVWTAAGGPYTISANLNIPNGVTLTIEPGTTVYVASGVTITVNGTGKILAQGTESNHIHIGRNPSIAGNWGSLDFINTTVESRLSYIDFDSCAGTTIGGHNAQLHVNNAIAFIDHCTWPSTPVVEFISFDASSFIVQNCTFPSYPAPTGPESLHGVNGIPTGGYGIFRDNYFGRTWGFNDTIDFTGGNRPGAILQIINNVFDGASDDCLDLDSTDAWIEGNIFLHVHRDPTRTDQAIDTGSAISGGVDVIGQNSDWTIINNLFYDVDHVFLNKGNSTTTPNGGGRVAFLYNTVMHVAKEYSGSTTAEIAAFDWSDDNIVAPAPAVGSGMYAAYNIIYDCSVLHHLYNPANHTVIMDNNILSTAWSGPGSGNQVVDPLLNVGVLSGTFATNVTPAQLRQAAQLLPGSPAIGTGFGGLNLGGLQSHGIVITGEPVVVTAATSATLTVGPGGTFNWGTNAPQRWGWTAFKWKLDNGAWSAEIVVTNNSPFTNLPTIVLTGLGNGLHTVYVTGKNDAGYYQDDPFVYPPTAGVPARLSASRTWTVNASGSDLRLNEILASNSGALIHSNTTPDAIELFNAGKNALDLSGVGLTDDISNPAKFLFPLNTTLAAGAYLTVFANNPDGTPGFHLGFNLPQSGGSLYLFNSPLDGGALIDSVTFGLQLTDLSIGRLTDGSWGLTVPTFGAANRAAATGNPTRLRLNEWLAIGQTPFANDFVELYNGDSLPVNLGGLYLSDEIIGWPDRDQIAALSFIPGNGYLRFIADGDGKQGAEHLNFTLAGDTGEIGLYLPDLTLIDLIVYQPQRLNVSQGRSPNGGTNIVFFDTPTPGAPNPFVTGPTPNGGVLVINEVLAVNSSIAESDGRTPDWIELYNGTTNLVNLGDYSLTDDTLQARRFIFAAGRTIAPGGYSRVLFDDGLPASTNNTGFALKSTGGSVYLFDALANGGSLLSAITYGLQTANLSIGRVPDGSTNWFLNSPTPSAGNAAVPSLGSVANLRVNEWMADAGAGKDDWFEIYNPNPLPVALGGLWLTDDLNSRTKQQIAALSFLGTGTNAWQKFQADGNTGAGADHVSFSLKASREDVGISTTNGILIDGIAFSSQQPGISEGRFPDGSTNIVTFPGTDSPGASNYRLLTEVVINEVLTHTDQPLEDAIELHNLTAQDINIGGWWLSDDNGALQKYQIPIPTVLPAHGFVVIYETHFTNGLEAAIPFALGSTGDETVLSSATNGTLTGYRTSVKFGAAQNGISFGRYLTSDGREEFVSMSARTLGVDDPSTVEQFRLGTGASNAYPRVGPIVISEIMYHPSDLGTNDNVRDEFIELHNITTAAVTLYDPNFSTNVWHLRNAVNFDFPTGTTVAAGGYLLVVSFDPVNNPSALAAFRAAYHLDSSIPIVGPYSGKLANDNDDIELRRPDAPNLTDVPYVLVERVKYYDTAPWPVLADGTGYSLQRVSETGFGNDSTNWFAATPTPGPQAASLDSDNDGIPNAWEITYSLDPFNGADAGFDSDGDGLTNWQEYQAGTNPRDAQSVLRIDSIGLATNGTNTQLTFTAAANRAYSVLWKESVSDGVWTKLADVGSQSVARVETVLDSLPLADGRIYRLVTPPQAGPANPSPAVLSSPQSVVTEVGGQASFRVLAVGSGMITCQWLSNGVVIPGLTADSLIKTNVQFSDVGIYSVSVIGMDRTQMRGPVHLTLPPRILTQPESQSASAGDTVTLSVAAEGKGTLRYRWSRNGSFLFGQTNATLTLTGVQPADAGMYSVTVTHQLPWGRFGVTSSNAVIQIIVNQ